MRWLVLVGILAALVLPGYPAEGYAAEKMTVSQLEQILAQRAAQPREPAKKHDSASDEIIEISDGDLLQQLDQDDELIPRIAAIELTERLSTVTMYHLIGKYNLGGHVQQALEQLADRSALLKLPPGEKLNKPQPDAEHSRRCSNSREPTFWVSYRICPTSWPTRPRPGSTTLPRLLSISRR